MRDDTVLETRAARRRSLDYWRTIVRGIRRRASSPSWLSRAAGAGLCIVAVGFVLLFGIVIEQGGNLTLITRPLPMRIALFLPYLVVVFGFATAIGAILGWWHRYWSLSARIHQTILAVLGIGFVRQLYELGFIVG